MKVTLKRLEISDFKGVKHQVIDFSNLTNIKAKNGVGKSTIVCAYYWLLANKDEELNENPAIRPNDGRECTPTVTGVFVIDSGREIVLSKAQKCKTSKPDDNGVVKVSLTNTYSVNEVPKSERDYKAYLTESGIDVEKYLQYSHPDMFLLGMNEKKSRDAIRDTLFGMATKVTDLEIAKKVAGAEDVAELLENYTVEEITAMQNASIRKVKENYGNSGEILRAKIEGLESAKSGLSVDELKKEADDATKEKVLLEIQAKKYDKSSEIEVHQAEVHKLHMKREELRTKLNAEHMSRISEMKRDLDGAFRQKNDIENKIVSTQADIQYLDKRIQGMSKELTVAKTGLKVNAKKTFDEKFGFDESIFQLSKNDVACPYCGSPFSAENVNAKKMVMQKKRDEAYTRMLAEFNERKDSFETKKAEWIAHMENEIAEREKDLAEEKDNMKRGKDYLKELEKEVKKADAVIANINSAIDIENKMLIDFDSTEDNKNILNEISTHQNAIATLSNAQIVPDELMLEIYAADHKITEIERKIAIAKRDADIDVQIDDLRKMQMSYEQAKADAEKILYQLDLVSRYKNEALTESVNKHFKLVKFTFFKYLKNGEYKNTVDCSIDGRDFATECNGARKILAKLDIVNGLQEYFNQHVPVLLDGAEALDSESMDKLSINTQLITFSVSDDAEMVVTNG